MPAPQARYWIGTIPHHGFTPYPVPGTTYMAGQLERSNDTQYLHWQLLVYFDRKRTLSFVRGLFGPYHFEPSRSSAIEQYVWKTDTHVPNTRFEFGRKALKRNSSTDWDSIWTSATTGDIASIPADVRFRHYSTIRKIASDHATAKPLEKQVFVFWGTTGTGKSTRAWNEAGMDAYAKDPRTKWWDGYRGQEHVVIDEFRGTIDIAHMLRWLDKFPVCVEIKGASVPLCATKIWITSNLSPDQWYPDLDSETKQALRRRLQVTHFSNPFGQ